jgi:hypothetical protein
MILRQHKEDEIPILYREKKSHQASHKIKKKTVNLSVTSDKTEKGHFIMRVYIV